MSYIKNYMFDLADKLGKDVNEVTQQDMDDDFAEKAQAIWDNKDSTEEEKQACKGSLPKITVAEVMSRLKPPISQYFTGTDKTAYLAGDVIIQIPKIGSKDAYQYKLIIDNFSDISNEFVCTCGVSFDGYSQTDIYEHIEKCSGRLNLNYETKC